MWRICEHSLAHPDPDHVEYEVVVNGNSREEWSEHSCDGCCGVERDPEEWGEAGSCIDKFEAEEIANMLRLHPVDWYYDQIAGKLFIKRGKYQRPPVAKLKPQRKRTK